MKIEKEIEFKTEITNEQYHFLIKEFNLNEKIYKLENYYFETPHKSFLKSNKTLRIRLESDSSYTLTLKSKVKDGTLEKHIKLSSLKALNMIENGFNLKEFFNLDIIVNSHGNLITHRVSMPYKEGILFFDKINYYNNIKYEIEYEVTNYLNGLNAFKEFLNRYQISLIKTKKKSRRVFDYLEKNKA